MATFGYTSQGASSSTLAAEGSGTLYRSSTQGQASALSEAGTTSKLTVNLFLANTPDNVDTFLAIYREDSAGSGSHDLVNSVESADKTYDNIRTWYDFTLETSLNADTYILAGLGNGQDTDFGSFQTLSISLDVTGSDNYYLENTDGVGSYATRKAENPWTNTASTGRKYSIYATYTAGGGVVAPNGNMTTNTKFWGT